MLLNPGYSESTPKDLRIDFPIDVVVTWVDAADARWQDIKSRLLISERTYTPNHSERATKGRLHELYYCLLSITHYLPWVNRIFLLTMRPQKPKYIKMFPKVKVIHHDQIYFDSLGLPTFNKKAIEAHLHKIPSLSEHFIYFNDDVYVDRPLPKFYFFSKEGKKLIYSRDANNQAMKTVNKFMGQMPGKAPSHVAIPLRKTEMQLAWDLFSKDLARTVLNRFNNPTDIWIIGVCYYLSDYTHMGVKLANNPSDHIYFCAKKIAHLTDKKKQYFMEKCLETYSKSRPALVCINNLNADCPMHKMFFAKFINMFLTRLQSKYR